MPEIARRDVFQAIADPTRRQIIQILSEKPHTLNSLAANFEISRSAVSQHIKLLEDCGVVTIVEVGRQRYCHIQPQSLIPAYMWLEQYKQQWVERIDIFEAYVKELHHKKSKTK